MKCPQCGAWSSVLDTREAPLDTTKRRRECANGHKFTTVEVLSIAVSKHYLQSAARSSKSRRARWARDKAIQADTRSQREIAKTYGIHQTRITAIKRRKL